MSVSPSIAARKADALHRRLVKGFGAHDFGLIIMTWVDGGDIVIRVKADHAPALDVRDWLNVEHGGHTLYRIASGAISRALKAEVDRRLENERWLAACAAMSH